MDAKIYTQNENTINGRKVCLYLITTPIGNIAVVDYEQTDLTIARTLFDNDYDKAEKFFIYTCKKSLDGKL